ncbi:hypothetical protein GALMADRAFT_246692 [Galerina marginata CBS 339.88]|uniref:Uncharacterized protein n=1 Tax=Galerina marginata (strain CBS 339.88) TaxID=685588 RepID=A0A067T4Q3_GALM3|nr:hypothetical protein GALMADRAFT_246692 [Galerina marginata CBS 339.88]
MSLARLVRGCHILFAAQAPASIASELNSADRVRTLSLTKRIPKGPAQCDDLQHATWIRCLRSQQETCPTDANF